MASETVEARLSALEREMAQIKGSLRSKSGPAEPFRSGCRYFACGSVME